jgi:hypothetical protein
MGEREVKLARQEAKRRKRSGQASSYMVALKQLAVEHGYDDWALYAQALAASPGRAPDFRVRLAGAGGDLAFGVSLKRVLAFHDLDEAGWERLSPMERVRDILECALSSRRERGDMARYSAELVESNVPSAFIAGLQGQTGAAPAAGASSVDPAHFVVELERREDGAKEQVGVQLEDLLEFHGLALADWESSGREEKEALVEEVALWTKRRTGDLGSYFTQVLSGLEGEEEGGEAPR